MALFKFKTKWPQSNLIQQIVVVHGHPDIDQKKIFSHHWYFMRDRRQIPAKSIHTKTKKGNKQADKENATFAKNKISQF